MKLNDYRPLGSSPLMVSPLGLGTMNFGQRKNHLPDTLSREDAFAILDAYVAKGGNFIDTANIYGAGESEEIIGHWMQERKNRYQVILATKCRNPETGLGLDALKDPTLGLSAKAITLAVEHSLERLQTDHIDLYQIHGPDPDVALEETMATLNSLVEAGKVRYLGICNHPGWQLSESMRLAGENGWRKFVCAQMQYNLLTRDIEVSVLPVVQIHKMGLIVWGPLAGGVLTGKYDRGKSPPEGSRFSGRHPYTVASAARRLNEATFDKLDIIREIAAHREVTPLHIAVAWLLKKPYVTSILMGPKKMAHLTGYLDALSVELNSEDVEKLEKVAEPARQYPDTSGTLSFLRAQASP